MMALKLVFLCYIALCAVASGIHIINAHDLQVKYEPNWNSLDSRPLPSWFDDAKFGIFIHWGVFSVPSFGSEWFWINWKSFVPKYVQFMHKHFEPGFTYQEFAKDFTAEFYNASQWAEIFEASGAKYIVLTSKHHEGYTLWPSKYSFSWNSMDVGPHKDLIGELATAVRKNTNLRFGLYHSLFEWFNPLYLHDKKNNFTTNVFVKNKIIPEMKELIETYKPEVLWSDGDWEASENYWESKEFLSWLYNDSPVKSTIVTNDRWGVNTSCRHGDFYNCQDRFSPGTLQKHKWENAMTIDKQSWGFRRNAKLEDYFTLKDLVKELVITVSTGGNLLMNVGPTKDGMIPAIFEERLRGVGQWLSVNGEAIYKTKPWKIQNDTLSGDVWYTQGADGNLYATTLSWPSDNTLRLSNAVKLTPESKILLLGNKENIKWQVKSNHIEVFLPSTAHKGEPAWVLKINHYQD
ncbi:alpha-L-fucosidase [Trichogramma pretiosum]|uniref:alpha-L-fucosidase n=1 Tax=Trichogramma pretiosum TaxID=7493 RepID=UPI0006C97A48|nr:alpha-L-fucosidase [Trichogramma pretiosum]XP_023316707.1 alpha-L-fucosidase [Trichogramma pretiosum]